MSIKDWLAKNVRLDPAARTPVAPLLRAYCASLSGPKPTRSVFIAELGRLGYALGVDGHSRLFVAGLTTAPQRRWVSDDRGRLVLASA